MSRTDRLVLCAAVAVLVAPILLDLAVNGVDRVFGYVAIDFFYYETIARNYLEQGFATFDQERATNGFHPIWQYTLVVLAWLSQAVGASRSAFFVSALLLSLGLTALALVFLARAQRASAGHVSVFLPWVVPGVFAIVTSPLYQSAHDSARLRVPGGERAFVGTFWRYVNGMETGAVLLAFFVAVLLLVRLLNERAERRPSAKLVVGCGLALGALALSRLDHAIFSLSLPLALLWGRARDANARRTVVLLWAIVVAVLGVYVCHNLIGYGSPVPVSGSVKSTFPRFTSDNWRDLTSLFNGKRSVWVYDAWRLAQELVPPFIATAFVVLTVERPRSPKLRVGTTALDRCLLAAVPGVFAMAAYNFFYVRSDFQGHWYFPVSVVLCSLFVARVLERRGLGAWFVVDNRRVGVWLLTSVAAGLGFFRVAHYRPVFNQDIARFYSEEAPRVRAAYSEPPKVLEFYDALFASSTGFPTMNGYGLVVDAEAARARKVSLDAVFLLAQDRGFDRIVSFNLDGTKLPEKPRRRDIVKLLKRYVSKEALAGCRVELEYRSADGRHVVIRVTKKERRD